MSTLKTINIIHPSGSTNNIVNDASGNITVGGTLAMSSSFMRNRIINGAMVIDQRNAGASITPTDGQYSVDRWKASLNVASKFSLQQSTTVPTGFKNSLLATSLSAYTIGAGEVTGVMQLVEGLNLYDLGWGASGALSVTLSFWARSSLTGTFGGSVRNSAANRSYPFSYTISAANTWEQKSITIPGDTSGTWLTDNGIGLSLYFSLGSGSTFSSTAGAWAAGNYVSATGATSVVGTNGATFYITGVQLEVGTVATPFEREIYSNTLAKCQRYLYRLTPTTSSTNPFFANASMYNSNTGFASGQFPQQMRTVPTLTLEASVANYSLFTLASATYIILTGCTLNAVTTNSFFLLQLSMASGGVTGYASYLTGAGQNTYGLQFSAEL
jgi:hypothetical protein